MVGDSADLTPARGNRHGLAEGVVPGLLLRADRHKLAGPASRLAWLRLGPARGCGVRCNKPRRRTAAASSTFFSISGVFLSFSISPTGFSISRSSPWSFGSEGPRWSCSRSPHRRPPALLVRGFPDVLPLRLFPHLRAWARDSTFFKVQSLHPRSSSRCAGSKLGVLHAQFALEQRVFSRKLTFPEGCPGRRGQQRGLGRARDDPRISGPRGHRGWEALTGKRPAGPLCQSRARAFAALGARDRSKCGSSESSSRRAGEHLVVLEINTAVSASHGRRA